MYESRLNGGMLTLRNTSWGHREIAGIYQGQPVIVAGDEPDEHDRFRAVVQKSMQRFQCAFPIVGHQVIIVEI